MFFPSDLQQPSLTPDRSLERALRRQLVSSTEIGLQDEEVSVVSWFGTTEGKPSMLWSYGTGAVYACVQTSLTKEDYERRIASVSATQTVDRKLVFIPCSGVAVLDAIDVHPQTKQVLPVIKEIYNF